jgi:hypothetical protein
VAAVLQSAHDGAADQPAVARDMDAGIGLHRIHSL